MTRNLKFFTNTPEILAIASLKTDGNMKGKALFDRLGSGSIFLKEHLPDDYRIIMAGIDHGNKVKDVDIFSSSKVIPKVDGLVTQESSIFLGVTFADCPFILFSGIDSQKNHRVVGAAHSGYKGTLKNIAGEMVKKMEGKKALAKHIRAVIGPGICKDCFEFGPEASEIFSQYPEFFRPQNGTGKFLVDLKGIIKKQLIQSGILEANIYVSDLCTFENESLFSFRREKMDSNDIKAGIALIGIKNSRK